MCGMQATTPLLFLSLFILSSSCVIQKIEGRDVASSSAADFVLQTNSILDGLGSSAEKSWFLWATNITGSNLAKAMFAEEELDSFMAIRIIAATDYQPPFSDDVARSLLLLRVSSPIAPSSNLTLQRRLSTLNAEMETSYSTSRVCGVYGHESEGCLTLDDLELVLAESRDPEELLSAWVCRYHY